MVHARVLWACGAVYKYMCAVKYTLSLQLLTQLIHVIITCCSIIVFTGSMSTRIMAVSVSVVFSS